MYYKDDEEKFGYISSSFYDKFISYSKKMDKFYSFVLNDLLNDNFNNILDVGCGNGIIIKGLAENKRNNLYGIDPSPYMVKIADKNLKKFKDSNIRFQVGSSRYVPFDIKFDVIMSSLSMHHWSDKESSIDYLTTKLNKGGKINIYEFLRFKPKSIIDRIEYATAKSHMVVESDLIKVSDKLNLNINIKKDGNFIRAQYSLK